MAKTNFNVSDVPMWGFVSGCMPVIGPLNSIVMIIKSKKYYLLVFPLIMLLSTWYYVDYNLNKEKEDLPDVLTENICKKISSIRFDPEKKYSWDRVNKLVRPEIEAVIELNRGDSECRERYSKIVGKIHSKLSYISRQKEYTSILSSKSSRSQKYEDDEIIIHDDGTFSLSAYFVDNDLSFEVWYMCWKYSHNKEMDFSLMRSNGTYLFWILYILFILFNRSLSIRYQEREQYTYQASNGKGGLIGFLTIFFPVIGLFYCFIIVSRQKKYLFTLVPLLTFVCGISLFMAHRHTEKIFENEKIAIAEINKKTETTLREYFSALDKEKEAEIKTKAQFYNDMEQAFLPEIDTRKDRDYARLVRRFYYAYEPKKHIKDREEDIEKFEESLEKVGQITPSYPESLWWDWSLTFTIIAYLVFAIFHIWFCATYGPAGKGVSLSLAVAEEPEQPVDEPVESLEPEVITRPVVIVKINEAPEQVIADEMELTVIQIKQIIKGRDEAPYADFKDFRERSGLALRVCERIKEQLDYTIPDDKRSTGRVIDF